MGKIQDSCFVPALVIGAIVGFAASFFNVFNMNECFWIVFAIVAALGAVFIFVSKIVEMQWADVGGTLGLLVGLGIGYLFA